MLSDTLLTDFVVRIPWLGPRVVYRLHRRGAGLADRDWSSVVRSVVRHRPEIVSVDVFDTCIVRDLVGDQAVERVIDRTTADGDGRTRAEVADDIERELCRPVAGVAESLAEMRQTSADIVFLSDTDRSSALLTEILARDDVFVDGDHLIASCEAGAEKSSGRLFTETWPEANRRSVWHVGNHPWADVTMSAASGINPVPVLVADANRYELAMAAAEDGFGPAVAGAARAARLAIDAERRAGRLNDHQAESRMLGADVAGQSMTAFLLWVAERCKLDDIEHLAFLARDGELPLQIASAMPADHWQGRSLSYLHCSRLTWSLASASTIGVDRWIAEGTTDGGAFLLAKRHDIPLSVLLARIGLTRDELMAEGRFGWLDGVDPTQPLPTDVADGWTELLADPAVRERVAGRSDERLKLIVDWLRAEGMPAGPYGLVDVGWRGQLASQVSAVLRHVVGQDPVHYHFGGDDVIPELETHVTIHRFAFDGISDPHPIEAPVSCVETMTASGKPRVVDYRRDDDGQVELVFGSPAAGEGGDRSELWAGAIQMAERLPARATLDRWHLAPSSLADEAVAVLDNWWNRPTAAEVQAIEGLTFEHDEAGAVLRPLVKPYRFSELTPDRATVLRQWPQGSAVISSPAMAGLARVVRTVRRIRARRAATDR